MAAAKPYTEKTPITAADLLNDRVLPLFEAHDVPLSRMLTDRGTAYCGARDRHPYELYLAINDIEHTRTRITRPQTDGICERFQKTILNEFYRVVLRRTRYPGLAELQRDPDQWVKEYNEDSTSGPLVLRQDSDADVGGYRAAGQGKTDCFTTLPQCLSDQILTTPLLITIPFREIRAIRVCSL